MNGFSIQNGATNIENLSIPLRLKVIVGLECLQ